MPFLEQALRRGGRALGRGERRADELLESRRIEMDDVLFDLVAVDAQAVRAGLALAVANVAAVIALTFAMLT